MDLVPLSIVEFILFHVFGCGLPAQESDGYRVTPQEVGHKPCFKHYILRTRTIMLKSYPFHYTTAYGDLTTDSRRLK